MDKRSNPIYRGCISYGSRPRLFSPSGAGEKRVTKEVLCRADPDLWEPWVANCPGRPGKVLKDVIVI